MNGFLTRVCAAATTGVPLGTLVVTTTSGSGGVTALTSRVNRRPSPFSHRVSSKPPAAPSGCDSRCAPKHMGETSDRGADPGTEVSERPCRGRQACQAVTYVQRGGSCAAACRRQPRLIRHWVTSPAHPPLPRL